MLLGDGQSCRGFVRNRSDRWVRSRMERGQTVRFPLYAARFRECKATYKPHIIHWVPRQRYQGDLIWASVNPSSTYSGLGGGRIDIQRFFRLVRIFDSSLFSGLECITDGNSRRKGAPGVALRTANTYASGQRETHGDPALRRVAEAWPYYFSSPEHRM